MKENAARQMGIDEAILTMRARGKVPNTLRFYQWRPSAISLGYFQSVKQEVNLPAVREWGVNLVRRITGGGAVFHDKELTYSLVISEDEVPGDIQESYQLICGAIVHGLQQTGLRAEFRKINDILVNNRKISGSAQTRRDGVVLQHGTLLLEVNVKKMFSLLKVPDEKIKDKLIKNVEERVTSLKKELGKEVEVELLRGNLVKGFENVFDVSFYEGGLTAEEEKLAKQFYKKYASREWTFKR